ncbi:MAG: penicillin-binding protein 1C [Lachnospiraceae bacterium]|nr:penicillin-binding protein 1C [Lachnospiraceae bacterium]
MFAGDDILSSLCRRNKINNKIKKIIVIFFACIIFLLATFVITVFLTFDVDKMQADIESRYSTSLLDANGKLMDVFLTKDEQWHLKVEGEVSDNLKEAVITYEDKNFNTHHGVDFLAIGRAFKNNLLGRKRSGASTITMQVAKLALPKKRTYFNKFLEIIHAFKIETKLDKDTILKLYLNNAPYGGNIVGYGTAARMYFQKDPSNLSWAECTLLAVLPNSPGAMNVEKNHERLLSKRNYLLDKLYAKGKITEDQLSLAKSEPLPDERYSFERVAPHLARRLYNTKTDKVIKTTIDYDLQKRMQEIVKSYVGYTHSEGITNAAMLIVENKTRNVKAYVGSQDFMDMENEGQVDGVIAKRSPGSILKPFLYALSIDEGIIAPESLVQDVPMFFANFNPQNANKKYTGMIEARQALISSLNIPFVHLLDQYGVYNFYYFLKDMLGFEEDNPDRYGLSLILGTKEFSVEDIAKLYSGLANFGDLTELNYVKSDDDAINVKRKTMFTKGASYLTLDTLKELVRPGINNLYRWKDPISWKTGTSYGKRDAWVCGMTPDYTVIVWVGNFSGKSNENLSGVISGGRLLFNVFQELDNSNKRFTEPFYELENLEVDKITGYRINIEGVETKTIKFPRKAKPLKLSPYYKKIYVDDDDVEIDSRSPEFANSHEKVILNYPLEVVNYFIRENRDVSEIYHTSSKEKSLKILYPTPSLKILLPKDLDKEQKLVVKIANLKNQNIYWYLDKEFIGLDKSYEKEIELGVGEHSLTIMAEDGEVAKTSFSIEKTR